MSKADSMSCVLTVADHEQNGFVALVKWSGLTECEARAFITDVDRRVDPDAEPDIKTAPFSFILDLCDGRDMIDNGERVLPTQVAMSLAPDEVRRWLDERPDPDGAAYRPIPEGSAAALRARAQQESKDA